LKRSWTGGSAPLLGRGRHNSITAAHSLQSTNFSNSPRTCEYMCVHFFRFLNQGICFQEVWYAPYAPTGKPDLTNVNFLNQ